ncbi:MAG TPA: hypothetical protein VIL04_02455 [Solirubrobacterales bacterium]|jgi:hypothetical protein
MRSQINHSIIPAQRKGWGPSKAKAMGKLRVQCVGSANACLALTKPKRRCCKTVHIGRLHPAP